MALTRLRTLPCLLGVLLAIPLTSAGFDTPLSDTAVREAYFLGQRRDETMARFLDTYTKHLAAPKSGPYISSVTAFTPYAQVVQISSSNPMGYSAQQAQIDHDNGEESVKVIVQILLTDSYGWFTARPTGERSGSPTGYTLRRGDFWKDFQIQVIDKDTTLRPFSSSGEPQYFCGGEVCTLTGATLQFEFLAADFTSDSVTVQIDPPEGDQVRVEFDLASVR
jgi:hypothetical protein